MKPSPLTPDEIQLFKNRLAIIIGTLLVVMLIWFFRLWYLQIIDSGYYDEISRGNRIRVLPQAAPRGIIYDRTGTILALNRPAFNIQVILEDTPDLEKSLSNLSRITNYPVTYFKKVLKENRTRLKFKPIALLKDIGRKTADLIETYQEDLPGISVALESKRLYPTVNEASHVLGYVGIINEDQLSKLPLNRLYSGRIVGQAGIELVQNKQLIGMDGGRQVEVDHVGRELRVLSEPVFPIPGWDIHLSLDLKLQRYARKQMTGKKGVILVGNPRTGEILSMVSYPDYDPNLFVEGLKDKSWENLVKGKEKPLVNKTTQGIYPPGSTYKMVVAAAALQEKIITDETTLNCPGYLRVGRETKYCWKRSGHGDVNVRQALEKSCNVFFYQLGMELGVDMMHKYAKLLGFSLPTGIELESEKGGLIPTRDWKKRVLKDKWYNGETPSVAIGQGYVSVTPIQLLNYINVIANGGLWVQPSIIRSISTPEGRVMIDEESLPRKSRLLPIDFEVFNIIREGLVMAVNAKGTAGRARSKLFTIAGKTGTSQVVGRKSIKNKVDLDESLFPHSLFLGYAPAENPQITVMVLVEHGDSGGKVAAPIAKKVLEYYSKNIERIDKSRLPPNTSVTEVPVPDHQSRLRAAFATQPGGVTTTGDGASNR